MLNKKILLRAGLCVMALLLNFSLGGCGATLERTSLNQPSISSHHSDPDSPQDPILIRSDYTDGEITRLCKKAIEQAKTQLEKIGALTPGNRTFDNTMLAFETALANFSDAAQPLTFMGYVSMNEGLRKESAACEEVVGQFYVEIFTRKNLYLAIKDQRPRNENEARLLSETIKSFEQNGLKFPDEKIARIKELKQKLSVLETQFSTNLNNDASKILVTATELTGLPADYVASLKKTSDGKYIVNTRESDYSIFLNNASNSEARRKFLLAYFNRGGKANIELLETAILLRQKIAKLMDFATWADYRTNTRMAKNAKTVIAFLRNLKDKLARRNSDDMARLLKFKQQLDPDAKELNNWDINYLSYQLKKRDYSLDTEKIREYFPATVVLAGMFDVYSKLLGVRFSEVKDAQVWSPDVKLYRIQHPANATIFGFFYADLFSRPSKYGHAAAFTLISGRVQPNNLYSYPVSAIVANLNPPTGSKPSLLSHDNVITLFHEFGHIMHQTLTRAPYASLSGSSTAQDFVEAPSQMLENWTWDAEILKMISGHYLDHSQKLPAELLKQMLAARDFNQGYRYMRQLVLATTDMTYHTATEAVNANAIYEKLFTDMIGVKSIEGGHFPANFGHLMGGYDAGYYGYLWSEVYAADMFTRFEKAGLLNALVGTSYRGIILEKGNMQDAGVLLKKFLGREPNSDAFFRKLQIERLNRR